VTKIEGGAPTGVGGAGSVEDASTDAAAGEATSHDHAAVAAERPGIGISSEMGAAGLRAKLEGEIEEKGSAATAATGGDDEVTPAEVKSAVDATPRVFDAEAKKAFDFIMEELEGRVTHWETYGCLTTLDELSPGQWLGVLEKLDATPWKGNRSQLDKFVGRGIEDDNEFIGMFADQANRKFNLGLVTRDEHYRAIADAPTNDYDGDKVSRMAANRVRREAGAILDHFGVDKSIGALHAAAKPVVAAGEAAYNGIVKVGIIAWMIANGGWDGPLG
jgi:hypothetical protein